MNTTIKKTGVLLIIFLLFSCNKGDDPEYIPVIDFSSDKKAAALIETDNRFALDLFREVMAVEEKNNFMISPVSVAIALGMTYNGADGNTKTAFENALRLQGFTRHEINKIHGALMTHLMKVDPKVTLEIANSIWINQMYTLLREFADTNVYYYDAEINSIDFYSGNAENIINGWISDATHGKITKVLDKIPTQTVMYLINALYFYGTWKYAFDEGKNTDLEFNKADAISTMVPAMTMASDLLYLDNELFTAIDLPYGSGNYSMTILMPKDSKEIADLVNQMDYDHWEDWMSKLKTAGVQLTMPKFKFDYRTLLNHPLSAMGLDIAFSGGADFSLMVEETKDLYISRVIHQTFVDVNEKGTEAAAVTVVEIRETSGTGGTIPVIIDRPFIFVIREKTSNSLVFMGKVTNPSYTE